MTDGAHLGDSATSLACMFSMNADRLCRSVSCTWASAPLCTHKHSDGQNVDSRWLPDNQGGPSTACLHCHTTDNLVEVKLTSDSGLSSGWKPLCKAHHATINSVLPSDDSAPSLLPFATVFQASMRDLTQTAF